MTQHVKQQGGETSKRHRIARHSCAFALLALGSFAVNGCRHHDFPVYPANYREFAYITNQDSNTVTVLDLVNVRLDREIQVGKNPIAVVANPKRNEVYILNSGGHPSANGVSVANGFVSVLDAEKNAIVANIPVHRDPRSLEVDADGEFAIVTNSGSNSVSILDLKARREVAVIGTGEKPDQPRISPDGKSLLVSNRAGNSVSILNAGHFASDFRLRNVIEGCPGAGDIAILPDSSKAFVACSLGHQIIAIAIAHKSDMTNSANTSVQTDALEALLNVGQAPVHLALKPDGGELFVSNSESDSISEVVTSTNDVGGAYLMGSHPVRGLVSADNSLLYICNQSSQEISVYAIDDGKRSGSIHVGDGPVALAFSAEGHLLLAVDSSSGDVAVIRTSTRSLFTLLPTGRKPNSIAIKAFRLP